MIAARRMILANRAAAPIDGGMESDRSLSSIRWPGLVMLAAALALNWFLAAAFPSAFFSYTSLALFVWIVVAVARITPTGAILLLPIVITRTATLVSLLAIEAGAYMPEVDRIGSAGPASASFVAFTAIFFLAYAVIFRPLERRVLAFARSPLLDGAIALLGWPTIAICVAWGAIAALQGMKSGFPLLEGVDRFYYRREYGSIFVLTLLDNKFLIAALLGAATFTVRRAPLLRIAGAATFLALTVLYFLFGDKFFTILAEASFFMMPLLLRRHDRLVRTLLYGLPPAVALLGLAFAATLYIYSGYGRLPLDRTMTLLGERIAGQGELWYVATHDAKPQAHIDRPLVHRYTSGLDDPNPAGAAFANGVETYFFIQHYAPLPLARNFQKSGGWVQLTMGYEAMALVMFGYAGVAIAMLAAGLLVALAALYLRRAFESAFPLSLFFAVWTFLQVYFVIQQASLWPIAAPGQIKRFLLFAVIELILLAFNRGQVLRDELRAHLDEQRGLRMQRRAQPGRAAIGRGARQA